MVGLSIVLETTNNNTVSNGIISPKPHQVINKSTVNVTTTAIASAAATNMSSLRRESFNSKSGFLEHCFLCRRKLLPAKDIYMYKGDRAFCSVECRSKQMSMDEEESLTREYCSFKTKADSPAVAPSRHGGDPRKRAGGFAY
ncbi:FCS-Like Zinc finger 15 [Cardamine amara subsp. amara]|uniref:FCS-Like Zinc finger 15 n=1 Tax=Cardamine amara subsp. amara TaxID=228776 RepID=A0ABD1B377_CARAN